MPKKVTEGVEETIRSDDDEIGAANNRQMTREIDEEGDSTLRRRQR